MKKYSRVHSTLIVFAICLVLLLFMARKVSKTRDPARDIKVDRQQGHQTDSLHSLVKNETVPSPTSKLLTSNVSFLHVIVQFPLLNVSTNNSKLVRERQLEYIQTLQRNLAHPLVKRVHVFCENNQTIKYILYNFALNAHKLVLKNIGRRLLYSDALDYVSNQLLFETSIIMNADIYIGKGFEQLDPKNLKQETMYALARHEDAEKMKACPGNEDFCGTNSHYIGSHDAFVMHLVRPLPDEVLQKTNFRPNIGGAENVFIYMLETYGHFRFKNPCSILYIIHNHCNTERPDSERYIEGKKLFAYLKVRAGLAPFSGL